MAGLAAHAVRIYTSSSHIELIGGLALLDRTPFFPARSSLWQHAAGDRSHRSGFRRLLGSTMGGLRRRPNQGAICDLAGAGAQSNLALARISSTGFTNLARICAKAAPMADPTF